MARVFSASAVLQVMYSGIWWTSRVRNTRCRSQSFLPSILLEDNSGEDRLRRRGLMIGNEHPAAVTALEISCYVPESII